MFNFSGFLLFIFFIIKMALAISFALRDHGACGQI
jgi:hypothetical protein